MKKLISTPWPLAWQCSLTLGLASLMFLTVITLGHQAWAQSQPNQVGATTDIILTKTVEVYSYEDLTFSIDSYTIRPGDNIANILKGQGLWPQKPDQKREAQLLRLVGELNPVIANMNQISVGQTIYLPSARGLEEIRAQAQAEAARLQAQDSNLDLKTLATYQLGQPDQTPARVVVRKKVVPEAELAEGEYKLWPEGKAPEDPAPDDDGALNGQLTSGVIPFVGQGQPPTNVAGDELDSEPAIDPQEVRKRPAPARPRAETGTSSNDGPLATASDGTVYRTVTVRKGDTLEKILRREGLDRNLIYRHLIKLTVELNPGLKNPNLIVAGAELRIPSSGGYLAGYGYEQAVASAKEAGSTSRTGKKADDKPAPSAPPAAGEKYLIPTKRLSSPPLPTMDNVNARSALGVIFTRIGEKVISRGRVFLPLDDPPHFDIDATNSPVIELRQGRKIILDFNSSLEANHIKRFTDKYKEYSVFQPSKKEPLDKALERLLTLCGYYRVYNKSQSFEGGRDVKLKISADWLVWPSVDAWNKGQPVIINLAPSADNGTPPVWVRFLADHGMEVIDLYQGRIIGSSGKSPTPVNNFTVINVDQNPSAFAVSLIRSLGYSPRVGVKVDTERGRVVTGGAEADLGNLPAVFWETDKGLYILEYGDLTPEELQLLRKNGFNIISSAKEFKPVLKAILDTEKITLGGNLVLNGSSTGGPSIQLTIAGQSFRFNGRSYLFTPVSLPDNMTSLDPNQNVVVLHYQQGPATVLSNRPTANSGASASSASTGTSASQTSRQVSAETLSDGAGSATITIEPTD
jgi:LysM repeat protein